MPLCVIVPNHVQSRRLKPELQLSAIEKCPTLG